MCAYSLGWHSVKEKNNVSLPVLFFSSLNTAVEYPIALRCAILGKGNKRKRYKVEGVTIRAEAIIPCQHYCFYSAHENLRSTGRFYSRGV